MLEGKINCEQCGEPVGPPGHEYMVVTLTDAEGELEFRGLVHMRCWDAFAAAHDVEPD